MFGIFGGLKFLKYVVVVGVFALIAFGMWTYHKNNTARITELITQNQTLVQNNATLESNNTALKDGIETANETVTHLQETYDRIQQDYQNLTAEFVVIRSQNDELRVRLSRHDLGALAAARPALVERRINNATANALRCFEVMTGAPIKANERNTECPWLFE